MRVITLPKQTDNFAEGCLQNRIMEVPLKYYQA